MEDEVIWNPNRSMNFIAKQYLASYTYQTEEYSRTCYKIRVLLKNVTLDNTGTRPGLWYATYESVEDAHKGLAQLAAELVLAGVIKEPKPASGNRFDQVELTEGTDKE